VKQRALVPLLFCGGSLLPLTARAQVFPNPPPANPPVFTKIGIRHYDAGVMADLATRPSGIIVVPPNYVIPAGAGPAFGLAAPAVTTVGRPLPSAASVLPGGVPTAPVVAGTNVLPEGVRRIFVLESDNSLVIEGTPEAAQALGDLIEGGTGR
jgi:hypothetical protein